MSVALEIRGLVKRFPKGRWGLQDTPAVDRVDLRVAAGEVVGLIGESGSGKTTLVRCALGLLPFQEGQVSVLGQPLEQLRGARMREHRRRFQLLFQDPRAMLNPGLTVRQHLVESARLRPEQDATAQALALAERVGLGHRLDAPPRHLSGGEQRRVGLARVLMASPELVVADEPTAGLDAALKSDLVDLILEQRREGQATLLVSHDLPLMAYACQRLVVMLSGTVIERFEVSQLGTLPHHPYTRGLLRAAGMLDDAPPARAKAAAGREGIGCPWYGPCTLGTAECADTAPALSPRGPRHAVACHNLEGRV